MSLRIISGTANIELAKDVSKHLGIDLTKRIIKKFNDGEIYVRIEENIRGDDVFVMYSSSDFVNDSLVELLILIDALKRASAGRITAVMNIFPYARQDRKTEAREPISAKLVADMLMTAGANRILAVDLHTPQIAGYFNIPVDEISVIPLFAEYFLDKKLSDIVVVSPDIGGTKRARFMAKRLNCPIAIIDKRRIVHNDAEVMNIVGNIDNKSVIILDDIIDTGNSIVNACNAILDRVKEVYIVGTHAVFSDGCIEKLINSKAVEIVVSNTLSVNDKLEKYLQNNTKQYKELQDDLQDDNQQYKELQDDTKQYKGGIVTNNLYLKNNKIKVISIAGLLSKVIYNIHTNRSISELFNK